ncbi:MAG: glycosyltransferase [Candidatus Thiodiazotropha sp.]
MDSSRPQENRDIELSFIIPALDEEANIGRLIDSIHEQSNGIPHEVIVVDNGSQDRTPEIAGQKGAQVLKEPKLNISGLRNAGARQSRGNVYIFLDGDIQLTQEWSEEFPKTLELLKKEKNIITGSRCGIPNDSNFLEKYWFMSLKGNNEKYINSAHLIIHKELFEKLQGFDPILVTGEDTDLSLRAKEQYNARIINNKKLHVLHHGYPKNLGAFVKREAWHGTRNNNILDVICCSPVQLATNIFLILHLILLYSVATQMYFLAVASIALTLGLLVASSLYKFGMKPKLVLINGFIFYFYYFGRSISIFKALLKI